MWLLLGRAAWACGGFMCDTTAPVDQAGEEIVFAVDAVAQKVTMHVRVEYAGPSEEFAWVIPVKGVPDLFLSHQALFDHVDLVTAPRYFAGVDASQCFTDADSDVDVDFESDSGTLDTGAPPNVWVLDTATVGAYETVTLGATDATALVSWLQLNEYAVPSTLDQALAPYLAGGMNFVALRLRSSGETGQLAPLALRYDGITPVIPLTLTAVAATPDMPITVYLLGASRGVPLNYLHTVLNPVAIDFWNGGANLDQAITAAANEAGGQGFATLAALQAGGWTGPRAADLSLAGLDALTEPEAFLAALVGRGFPLDQRLVDALSEALPAPEDFEGGALAYYEQVSEGAVVPVGSFDPVAAVAALQAQVVTPLADAEALVAGAPWVTRLRSSMSPAEMTTDPTFAFNADLPAVDATQRVTVEVQCASTEFSQSRQLLRYPDGIEIMAPSQASLDAQGLSLFQWVQTYARYPTLRIEQMDTTGQPVVVVDHAYVSVAPGVNPIQGGVREAEETPGALGADGCGCQTGGGRGARLGLIGLMGLIGLGARRRRLTAAA